LSNRIRLQPIKRQPDSFIGAHSRQCNWFRCGFHIEWELSITKKDFTMLTQNKIQALRHFPSTSKYF